MSTGQSFETEGFFANLLEDHQDDVFVYDCETLAVHYANKSARQRCGWDEASMTSKRITEASSRFDEPTFWAHVAPLLSADADHVPFEAVHEKGPVSIRTRLDRSPNGRQMFVSVLRDTTEEKRVEAARTQYFSELSHELRTPLTSIKGALRFLESGMLGALSDDAQKLLDVAARNTERVLKIVNEILELQKLDAGKSNPDTSILDLIDLAREAIAANTGYGWEHDVFLVMKDLPQVAMVDGNWEQLIQVMGNLLSNAIKHSPKGEMVVLRISEAGQNWRVTVSDQGPGIPENLRDGIFNSFTTAQNGAANTKVGTGLGLAIAKKIVALHNGSIGFDSGGANGTDFYFDLPKAPSEAKV
jgi:signal transduction histidine kinase